MEKRGQRLDPNDCIGYYCKQQIGSGSYFASNYPIQRDYGLFSNLRRYAMPIMMKAGKYLGKHLLSTGQNVLVDISQGKSFKEASKYINCGNENGIQIPTTAYTPDYAKDLYARNYLSLFTDLAQHKTNVSYDDYKENICLYVFDLTQEKSASEPFGNVTRSGDISIHLKFDAELPETATLIAYMEMPSRIEIDKSRNVFIDY
ncbi:uncharacterized protein TNCV_2239521 [Trichonephila clavipes]|nr:uncharacterized protein TNCV_2239521 [Trichonephila clavipes]